MQLTATVDAPFSRQMTPRIVEYIEGLVQESRPEADTSAVCPVSLRNLGGGGGGGVFFFFKKLLNIL